MALYERTQRESAHVSSRVVDKSKVPSALTWAALGCITASKGNLNEVYQVNSTEQLASYFGDPSSEHVSLICADKIIAEDNTMFLIRVAHENSLRGAQVVVPTEEIYGTSSGQKRGFGAVTGTVTEGNDGPATNDLVIQIKEEDEPKNNIKNIADNLSMDVKNGLLTMENSSVMATYRDVYQIDEHGNRTYSNELCLLLSDVSELVKSVKKSTSGSSSVLNQTQYEDNWFYGEGYAMRTAVVLKASSSIVENTPCDVIFEIKQSIMRAYDTSSPNKVTVPVSLKTSSGETSN